MKHAYLILAHNSLKHLELLVNAMNTDATEIFVHIDAKSDIGQFKALLGTKVHFIEDRVPVFWGDFSQVEAILRLLFAAKKFYGGFDRYTLLSGVDYPIRDVSYIENYFKKNASVQFMNIVAVPSSVVRKPISRFVRPRLKIRRISRNRVLEFACTALEWFLPLLDYRKELGGRKPFAGSTWWSISGDACDFILKTTNDHPELLTYFSKTQNPDESFFQTILGNSPFATSIQHNLTYADWSEGKRSPAWITQKHIDLFTMQNPLLLNDAYGEAEALFARKFADDSTHLVEMIAGRSEFASRKCHL